MLTLSRKKSKISPDDHGRPMSLGDFEFAKTQPGFHYELSRGYVAVSEVANYYHALIVTIIRNALVLHQTDYPDEIHMILTEMGAKLIIPEWDSERHPDIAVYLTKPRGKKDRTMWRTWIPGIAIEVVSANSEDRDYVMKREEYWTLGIKEYWLVDAQRKLVILLKRGRSDWIEKRLDADDVCTTKLLPKFKLPVEAIFDAVADSPDEAE